MSKTFAASANAVSNSGRADTDTGGFNTILQIIGHRQGLLVINDFILTGSNTSRLAELFDSTLLF